MEKVQKRRHIALTDASKSKKQQDKGSSVLHFEVDAGLLFQLGEQLVARRSIALAELIKNGYDADATRIIVTFEGVTKPGGTITVVDNGSGMTFEEVEHSWMRIASSEKRKKLVSSRFCRPLTGAKGVGRFAIRRLSNKLTLSSVATRKDGSKERVLAEFNWKTFQSGQTLTGIPVTFTRQVISHDTPTGVTLHLQDLREIWQREDAVELQEDLLILTSPFEGSDVVPTVSQDECEADPGFTFELQTEEFPELGGKLNEKFLESAWGKLTGYVDEGGVPHYDLQIRGHERPELFIPDIGERERLNSVTGAQLVIYFVVYKSGLPGDIGIREASAYGRSHGGVKVYLDSFRVFAYGVPGDDWLDLDKIRASRNTTTPSLLENVAKGLQRPILSVPGNNQLFGAVYISQAAHPELELTINRERLIESKAFDQLKMFVQTGVFWLTIQYARQRLIEKKQARTVAQETTITSSIERLEKLIDESTNIDPVFKAELRQVISVARFAAERREEELISELSLLRVLASAGTMIIIFGHQLRAMVDGLIEIHSDLLRLRKKLPQVIYADYDGLLEQLDDWRVTVEEQAKQIGVLLGVDARQRKRRLAVSDVVNKVIQPLRNYTKRFDIKVENKVPSHLRTPPMFEAELHAILLNIFTNALKAVREQQVRRIQISATQSAKGIYIRMSDTGTGLADDKWEEVFRPLVTTSRPDPILGIGTGLGLKVVRDLTDFYGGTAKFVSAKAPWKTAIEVFFPREV